MRQRVVVVAAAPVAAALPPPPPTVEVIRGDKRAQEVVDSSRSSHHMVKTGAFILVLAVFGAGTHMRAKSDTPAAVDSVAGATTTVTLLVGRSTVVDVRTSIARVSLTSADVADALVTSPASCWCTASCRAAFRCSCGIAPA